MSEHPQAPFRHVICAACYSEREPGREPIRVRDDAEDTCCFCGARTSDGIYYRAERQPYCGIGVG